VSRIRLLQTPFTFEEGTLTRTMKVRRNKVFELYAKDIEALFR
jgi:long-subunit acyl-CoA synthetase (AMP-forming)